MFFISLSSPTEKLTLCCLCLLCSCGQVHTFTKNFSENVSFGANLICSPVTVMFSLKCLFSLGRKKNHNLSLFILGLWLQKHSVRACLAYISKLLFLKSHSGPFPSFLSIFLWVCISPSNTYYPPKYHPYLGFKHIFILLSGSKYLAVPGTCRNFLAY